MQDLTPDSYFSRADKCKYRDVADVKFTPPTCKQCRVLH